MKNNAFLLLRTLLLSTSSINILKHTTDKKKKGRIIGGFVGLALLYAMLMAYCIATCAGLCAQGLGDSVPAFCVMILSGLALVFTFFKTNGYLFNFKEYDMLMSLPFGSAAVAGCKFLYMYVKSLPWYLIISYSMMGTYAYFTGAGVLPLILWFLLTFFVPLIPMLAASLLGFLIARISAGFKKSNVVQTVLSVLIVLFAFSIRFILEDVFRNDKVEQVLEKTSDVTEQVIGKYPPGAWFANAVTGGSILQALLLIAVSTGLFLAVFTLVGRSYRNINSSLKNHAASGKYRMTSQKTRSTLQAIAFKEFKRMMGSTIYATNVGMGEILVTLVSVATLILGFDRIVDMVTQNAPFDHALLQPAIPFIVYFFIGMVASTVCSPSLEGKNYWIVQSLPIEKKTLYQGKMLYNMYLTVPFALLGTLCMCISARVPFLNAILYLILSVVLCAFSTAWGCVCGIKHMRLDWENEVEVIKQGVGVVIYMFPNMFVVMGLCVLTVVMGRAMDHKLVALVFIVIAGALTALSYRKVLRLSRERG